jgi:DNA-binding NarL/FixJ family response regulator
MRLLIVADSPLAAEGIRRTLRHTPGCCVLGFVNGRESCLAIVVQTVPDVVVVDDRSESANVLDRIGEVRTAAPDAKIVLLTARLQPEWLTRAAAAGMDAAIANDVNPMILGTLVREIVAGNVFHVFAPAAPPPPAAAGVSGLTAREVQSLRLVAAGKSNALMAVDLGVTEQTVKFHLSNIYRKLGLKNRTEASHFAHVNGLVEPSDPESAPKRRAAA